MLTPEMILNAEMVSAGIVVDHMGYMTKVCLSLYGDLAEWLTFWCDWNDSSDFEYWITDEDMDVIRKRTLQPLSESTRLLTESQLTTNMELMNGNVHYTVRDGERMWTKRGVLALLDGVNSEVIAIMNTLDYVSSMYWDYVEGLNM